MRDLGLTARVHGLRYDLGPQSFLANPIYRKLDQSLADPLKRSVDSQWGPLRDALYELHQKAPL